MQQQILIAGGGIGGLAAGLALARDGHAVRLYERADAFGEVGAGIQLGPNVMRVLGRWDLADVLERVVAHPTRLEVRHAGQGKLLASLPFDAAFADRYGARYTTVHRADLHGVLLNALQSKDSVWMHTGHIVERHQDAGDGVRLWLDDGLEVEGDVLVGADGLWSGVRAQCVADGAPRVPGHLAYRAMVRQADLPVAMRSDRVTVWLGPQLHLVQYPVRCGEWLNVVAIVEGEMKGRLEDWNHAANGADLQALVASTCATVRDLVAAIPSWRLWILCDRPPMTAADQMVRGRVALLGDAAHPMRPYLAQGAGMAIEDAAELALNLAQAETTAEIPSLLQRYAVNRWPRAASVQAQAIRNGSIYHLDGPVAWARDLALRGLGARLLDQPWLYGGGPVPVPG